MGDSIPVSEWEEKCAELEDAFRKLPIRRNEAAPGIPYEFIIPGIGRELMLMRPNSGVHPPKAVSADAAKKELRDLARKTEALIEVLDGLSRTSLDALNYREVALRKLKTNLRIFQTGIITTEVQESLVNTGRGAPKKIQPRKIARLVAQHYYALTGKKPTAPSKDGKAYGPFVELLNAVYRILGVEASAESQTKSLREE